MYNIYTHFCIYSFQSFASTFIIYSSRQADACQRAHIYANACKPTQSNKKYLCSRNKTEMKSSTAKAM